MTLQMQKTKMGSAKTDTKPVTLTESTNKKSIKNILQSIFQKDSKKKTKKEDLVVAQDEKKQQEPVKAPPAVNLLQDFTKLKINEAKEDDELKNFTIKTIEETHRVDTKKDFTTRSIGGENIKGEFSQKVIDGSITKTHKTVSPKDEFSQRTITEVKKDISRKEIETNTNKEENNAKGEFSQRTIKEIKKEVIEEDEDEIDQFSERVINLKDDDDHGFSEKTIEGRINRYGSNSSEDSGFSEKSVKLEEVEKDIEKLSLGSEKKKRVQTVFVSRGPIRSSHQSNLKHPYQQISNINKQTFSGGQVIVNTHNTQTLTQADESVEISKALSEIDAKVDYFAQQTQEEQNISFELATDYVTDDNLADFLLELGEEILKEPNQEFIPYPVPQTDVLNPVEEFSSYCEGFEADPNYVYPVDSEYTDPMSYILTPPRSNESYSQQSPSFYSPPYQKSGNESSPHTDYTLSPDRGSPNNIHNDDHEKYQVFDTEDLPASVNGANWMPKDKLSRSSSISMKNIKDTLKQLQAGFAKKLCCKRNGAVKELFHQHFNKVSPEQRKNICMKISGMDFKTAYGVLHHILISLSSEVCEQDSVQYTMFYLICQQVLAQKPMLFTKDFGLNLLIAASLRCPFRVELVTLLVQIIRSSLSATKYSGKGPLFTEVDSRGDNLVGALARCGDTHADVLTEIVVKNSSEITLFDVNHANTEGFSPLHLACMSHNTAEVRSCLHTVHVLLAHGNADLYKGDNKAGDTALHIAVNSITCDLQLVQTLFLHVDRKFWKQYAHLNNRSSVSPLEYARSATKSRARQNYPMEVLDMLKKCR